MGQECQFTASTISSSIAQGQAGFDDFIQGWEHNKFINGGVFENISQTTLGVGNYLGPNGEIYEWSSQYPYVALDNYESISGSYTPFPAYDSQSWFNSLTPLFQI